MATKYIHDMDDRQIREALIMYAWAKGIMPDGKVPEVGLRYRSDTRAEGGGRFEASLMSEHIRTDHEIEVATYGDDGNN